MGCGEAGGYMWRKTRVCVGPEFCEWRSRLCLRKEICWGSGERNEGTCVVYRWGVEGETGLWIFVYVDRRVYVSV